MDWDYGFRLLLNEIKPGTNQSLPNCRYRKLNDRDNRCDHKVPDIGIEPNLMCFDILKDQKTQRMQNSNKQLGSMLYVLFENHNLYCYKSFGYDFEYDKWL